MTFEYVRLPRPLWVMKEGDAPAQHRSTKLASHPHQERACHCPRCAVSRPQGMLSPEYPLTFLHLTCWLNATQAATESPPLPSPRAVCTCGSFWRHIWKSCCKGGTRGFPGCQKSLALNSSRSVQIRLALHGSGVPSHFQLPSRSLCGSLIGKRQGTHIERTRTSLAARGGRQLSAPRAWGWPGQHRLGGKREAAEGGVEGWRQSCILP